MSEQNRLLKLIDDFKRYQKQVASETKALSYDSANQAADLAKLEGQERDSYIENLVKQSQLAQDSVFLSGGLQGISNKIAPKIAKAITSKIDEIIPSQVRIKPEDGKRIAQAYENLKSDSSNPDVQKAYQALINELKPQYQQMVDDGFKFTKIKDENPYKSSKDMHDDIEANKHLYYFPTEKGFGSNAADNFTNHPLMTKTGIKADDGEDLLANDLFRIVHDYRGHHLGQKSGFGPKGEQSAYLQHKKDFSPEASKALFTETAGQNNTVNFGKYGEQNRTNPAETVFADQKAALFHDDIINNSWHSEKPVTFENLKKLIKGK